MNTTERKLVSSDLGNHQIKQIKGQFPSKFSSYYKDLVSKINLVEK